jgi:hypothetical protein
MCDANGSLQAIVRRNGTNGDIVAPAAPGSDFQLVVITWGPAGVSLHRNGELIATNHAIDAVSSDPAITALRIGGPGSGPAAKFSGDLTELRVYAQQLDEVAQKQVEAELRQRWFDDADQGAEANSPIEDLYDELLSPRGPFWVAEEQREQVLPEESRARLAALRAELEVLKKKPVSDIPRAVVVQEGGPAGTKHEGLHDAAIYIRGNPANPGPTVPRGFPRVLCGEDQPAIREGSGRRELANWLASPENPLTARVMVNRIWQHHFGAGLVRTSTNFGARGERPSHQDLLDYLAQQLIASGWSIKAMHRLMMLSSTYQTRSRPSAEALAGDPENRLLGRTNRRRLEAEAIRDSLLMVAGRLDTTAAGPAFTDVATPRRSLYLMSVRTGAKAADFGPLFDGPDCGAIVEQRMQSTVAPQALFFMNDAFVLDLAAALAERIAREISSDNETARVERLYEIVLGRWPTSAEVDVGLHFLAGQPNNEAWARFCHVVLCTNEFIYVE